MATTGIASAFTPGISLHFMIEIAEHPPVWRDVFHYMDMDSAYVDEQGFEGYGLPATRLPGQAVKMGSAQESFNVRYVPDMYSLGDTIPKEDLMDDIYGVFHRILPSKAGSFARAFRYLLDVQNWGLLINYGYAPGNIMFGPDRLSLMNVAHPVSRSNLTQTWANRPSVDIDLSIAAYNWAWLNILSQPDPNNVGIIENELRNLICHPSQRTIALQITQGNWQPNTDNRNMNVARQDNAKVIMSPYFRKSGTVGATMSPPAYNAWACQGRDHYLKFFMRENFDIDTDSDINTRSEIFAGHIRFANGWSDPRGFAGSLGN